ncbi:MAG: hypothetical protein A2992_05465 [Elusimicrobia bacterium RIFCSPLOWO2_01_FULL_59_12]|nr:MAG: hypothetical protein A2992_05465 [Elusimicrobia bacterium RIFCSPLOWO2_01_FULL_59_12]
MKTIRLTVSLMCLISSLAFAKLKIVTTTQDMAALAREVGGDRIDILPITKGYQDPHFVDAKPSYLLKLRSADLLIVVGRELEVGWLPPLLTNARNSRILPGGPGFLDASEGCDVLQKPAGQIDRSMGDIHPFGNPHYWLDPENGRIIARNIARKLSEIDPDPQKTYEENLRRFESALDEKETQWKALAAPLRGMAAITYHNSLPNFAKAFGIRIVNHVEPKPGVPPSPVHMQELITQIRKEKIPVLLIEPYFDDRLPMKIAHQTGAKMLVFPPSVGGVEGVNTYFELFDYDLKLLKSALGEKP